MRRKVAPASRAVARAASCAVESLECRRLLTAVSSNVIDIYMGYTAPALQQVGSVQAMNDKISRAIGLLNQTLADSKVAASVRLVGTMQTNYTESGSSDTDISRLTNLNDGQLDDLTNAGVAAGADVIDVIVSKSDAGGITSGNYNEIYLPYLDNGVLTHEFGHTLGGGHGHDMDGTSNPSPFGYEAPLVFGNQTYEDAIGGNLNYYSNTNVFFRGVSTGVNGVGPDAANNVIVMNQNVAAVSNFRTTTVPDTTGPVAELGSIFAPNSGATTMTAPLSRAGWVLSTNTNPGAGDAVANAIDGNLDTRFSSDTPQAPGQFLQVDLGSAQNFSTLSLDTGPGSTNDFPRGYSVYVSNNNTDWATQQPIATGAGTSQLTNISFNQVNARYVRIVQTGTQSYYWWSVAELNIGTAAPAVANTINFQVIYTDGSGVNVSSLGNDDVQVSGPNGFSQAAQLLSIDDPSGNFGYHVVTYSVTTPGPVGSLSAYTFSMLANGVSDQVGNFAPAGKLALPSPLSPDIAGSDYSHAAELGDLTGMTWQITDEVGQKYQSNFFDPAVYHFSVSRDTTLTLNASGVAGAGTPYVSITQDVNGNLADDGQSEKITASSPGVYNLKAGKDYYITVVPSGVAYALFTLNVVGSGVPSAPAGVGKISGTVFGDANNDGIKQSAEPAIISQGLELTGTDANNNPVDLWAYTDAGGNYTFSNVPISSPAGYTIKCMPIYQQNLPTAFGINSVGSLSGTLSGADSISAIVVTSSANGINYNFSATTPPPLAMTTLSGTVYFDLNSNHVKDPGEAGIGGAMLTLSGADARGNSIKLTAVTNADGTYAFNNVPTANPDDGLSYTLQLAQPTTAVASSYNAGAAGGFVIAGQLTSIVAIKVNGTPATGYDFTELPITATTPAAPVANNANVTTAQNTATTGTVMPAQPATTGVAARAVRKAAATPATSTEYAELVPGSGPQHAASFTFNSDGTYTYTPVKNYYGTDSFMYELIDSATGRAATATVRITISHVDQPPTFTTETENDLSTSQRTPLAFDLQELVDDPDSLKVFYRVGKVTGGTAALQKDGHTVVFTPSASFVGTATVKFTATDGKFTTSMSVNIDVYDIDFGPTAKADSATTPAGAPVEINVLANDTDEDGLGIFLSSVTQGAHGSVYIDDHGTTDPSDDCVVYTPNAGFRGVDTFTYTIVDFMGRAATATVSVKVTKPTSQT